MLDVISLNVAYLVSRASKYELSMWLRNMNVKLSLFREYLYSVALQTFDKLRNCLRTQYANLLDPPFMFHRSAKHNWYKDRYKDVTGGRRYCGIVKMKCSVSRLHVRNTYALWSRRTQRTRECVSISTNYTPPGQSRSFSWKSSRCVRLYVVSSHQNFQAVLDSGLYGSLLLSVTGNTLFFIFRGFTHAIVEKQIYSYR